MPFIGTQPGRMRLPAKFPHTRHEQYLVTLPAELLSEDEVLNAPGVIHGLRRYLDLVIVLSIVRLHRLGVPDDEIDRVIAAAG